MLTTSQTNDWPARILRGLLVTLLLTLTSSSRAQDVSITPHASARLSSGITALAFSGDGKMLAAGDAGGNVVVWEVETMVSVDTVRLDDDVLFVGFAAGDTAFVAIDADGRVRLFSIGSRVATVSTHTEERPVRVALDAGRRYVAVATRRERIELFDLNAGRRVGTIDARDEVDGVLYLGFDRLGRQLVAVSRRGEVASWNPVTQQPLRRMVLSGGELHGSRSKIHAVSTNRSANILVVGLEEVALPKGGVRDRARPGDLVRRDMIIAYDWNSGMEIKRVAFSGGVVQQIALGPGNDRVAVANDERETVTFIDLRSNAVGTTVSVEATPTRVEISDDDRWMAVGTDAGEVSLWSLEVNESLAGEPVDEALPSLSGRIRVIGEQEPIIAPESSVTMAILPFDNRGVSEDMANMTPDILMAQLANVEHLTLVERLRIDALLDELALQERGITVADGLQVGKMLNADYVLLGSLSALGTTFTFSVRMLNVETSEIESGRQIICEECRAQDLFDAIHLLSTTIAE